jgi:hypothetical protein
MKINIKIVVGVFVAALAAIAIFHHGGRGDDDQRVEQRVRKNKKPYLVQKNAAASAVKYQRDDAARKPTRKGIGSIAGRFAATANNGVFCDSDDNPYPPEEQKIMAAAAAAIEHDDLNAARDLADKALASGNKDLREAVVDALGWFGADAMAELTPFMSDPDGEVADAASSHWKDALQEIDDEGLKAGIIEMSVKALKNNDMIEDVANELIGIDELAAIQVIVNVIESGGAAADAMRDVYDSITGDEWRDIDAAESWLQENYEPDDDDEGQYDEGEG